MNSIKSIISAFRRRREGGLVTTIQKYLIDFSIRYSAFWYVIPYNWDSSNELIIFEKSGKRYYIWLMASISFLIHSFLVWIDFGESLLDAEDTFEMKTWIFFAATAFSVPSILQIILHFHTEEFVKLCNESSKFFSLIERKHWILGAEPYGKIIEILTFMLTVVSIIQPYLFVTLYIINPFTKVFLISSNFLSPQSPTILIILGVIPSFVVSAFGWGTLMFVSSVLMRMIFTTIFLIQQISSKCPPTRIDDSARIPATAYLYYRSLQILVISLNVILKDTLFYYVQLFMALTVVPASIIIVFHKILPYYVLAVFFLYAHSCSTGLVITHIILGQLHECSKSCIRSWNVMNPKYINSIRNALILKQFRSCRLMRVELGCFGYIRKSTSMLIIGKMLLLTSKFLVILRSRSHENTSHFIVQKHNLEF